jgi:hypothetical protein
VTLRESTSNLEPDDPATAAIDEGMVLLYNNVANFDPSGGGRTPQWKLAQVQVVQENALPNTLVTLNYAAYDPNYNEPRDSNPPVNPADFGWSPPEQMPKIARVSVVRYSTVPDAANLYSGPPAEVLRRETDFRGNPQPVAYLEDFQVRYVIGVTAPIEQDMPPDAIRDLGAGTVLTSENTLSSVRISVTARSVSAGFMGSDEGALVGDRTDDFIRKTFSTNVNPRNMTAGIEFRTITALP